MPTSTPKKPRKKTPPLVPSTTLVHHVVEAMQAKKGQDIVVMDVREVMGIADYFVICSGEVDLQVKAIVDAVRDTIKEACSERPWHVEGYTHRSWVILDYVTVVVHVFDQERRTFYNLERLWGDAPTEHVADEATVIQLLQAKETTQEDV